MKNKCKIVRDLMPLVIDGAASEESQRWVDKHVKECEDCQAVYTDMQAELPKADEQAEQEDFDKAARQMKRRRKGRSVLLVLVSLLLGVALFATGSFYYQKQAGDYTVPMDFTEYTAQLYRLRRSESVVLILMPKDPALNCVLDWQDIGEGEDTVRVVALNTGKIRTYKDGAAEPEVFIIRDGRWSNEYNWYTDDDTLLSRAALVNENKDLTIYQAGVTNLPLCSLQMEQYFIAVDAYEKFLEGPVDLSKGDYGEQLAALEKTMQEKYRLVPEWNNLEEAEETALNNTQE